MLQPALQEAADAFGEKDEVHFGQVNGYKEKAIQTRYEVKGHPSFKVTSYSKLSLSLPRLICALHTCSRAVVRQRQHGCVAVLLRPLHRWIRGNAHQNGEWRYFREPVRPPAQQSLHEPPVHLPRLFLPAAGRGAQVNERLHKSHDEL